MFRSPIKWLTIGAVALAAITGTTSPVFATDFPGTLEGHLTDGGEPIAAAEVTLVTADYNYLRATTTDQSGAFRLRMVPPGDYKLKFTLPGGFEQWATQKADFEAADLVNVTGGQTTTVEESVRPHGGITGHVYSADGSPAAYTHVSATKDGSGETVSAATDEDGLYVLRYLEAGDYRVSFLRDYNSPSQYADNVGSYEEAALIPVTVGQVTTLDQTLVELGAITGRVTDNNVGVGGVEVNAYDPISGGQGWATTESDGTYRIPVFPGSYNVAFQFPEGLTQYAPKQFDPTRAGLYTVTAGNDTVLDEKLRPTGTLSGRLTDWTGEPVPYAAVQLTSEWYRLDGTTDESGAYEFTAFPGPHHLAFHTGHGTQWSHGKSTADTADPVSIEADTNLVVNEELAEPGRLVVTAEDQDTHEAVADFCADLGFAYPCTSTGTVTAEEVLPGRYSVSHSPQWRDTHLGTGSVVATVSSRQTTTATLPLARTGSVTTTITDRKTGAPVPNACLEMIGTSDPTRFGVNKGDCSDENGEVTVPSLRPGSYKSFVWIDDGVHGMQWVGQDGGVGKFIEATTVTIAPGQSLEIPDIRLDESGAITGTVTDELTGEPIRNATVGLSSFSLYSGEGGGLVTTDAAGRYTQSGLGPYGWTLYFSVPQYATEWSGDSPDRSGAAGIMVSAGETTIYDTAVGRGTVVTGKLSGPSGGSASGNVIVVNAESNDEIEANYVPAGTARYSLLVKGPQQIKLRYFGTVLDQYYSGWLGGDDFTSATVFSVPSSGTEKIDVKITQTQP